jgi:PBP1b-binding outer membrane lipoprotein LpoB
MKISILILLAAFCFVGCAEEQQPAPIHHAKKPAPTPTPGFHAVEKPESYSQ